MGKKVKKRAAHNTVKEKRFPTSSPKTVSQVIVPATDTVVDGISVVKETQACPHLEEGINLEKFSLKISPLESLKCDDCRDSVTYRRTKKGNSKHGKTKGNGSKPESTSIWVCLECGHFSCGGVGFPTTPQSHAARHSKQNRHPLVIQLANTNLRWCFPCSRLIPVQSFENEEQKDSLSEFVKLMKTQPSSETRVDVEDIWFGGGNVTSMIQSVSTSTSVENGDGHMAPQFKGFQQHDSHELLRCLLDGLCTEESRVRKRSQDGKNSPKHAPTFVDKIFGGQISSTVSCLECGHASVVYEPCLDLSLPLPTKNSQSKRATSVSRSKKPKLPPKRHGKFLSKSKKVTNILTCDKSLEPTKSNESCIDKNFVSGDSTQSELQVYGIKEIGDCIDISSDNLAQLDHIEPTTLSNSYENGTVNSSNVSSLLDHSDFMASNGHDTTVDQVNSIDSEEALSWLEYLEPNNSTVHDMTSQNQDSYLIRDSGNSNDAIQDSGNSNEVIQDFGNSNDVVWEDEPLLKVQESDVLLLPYKDVTSTSEQEPLDFDGFGGLFDEPELADGPTVNPLSNGIEESESEPDEVDDTDSPVSVEKCLAYFTTPEILTKTEHAWQCEKCSKSLLEQKTRLKNKLQKFVPNGGENEISSVSSDLCIEHEPSNGFSKNSDQSTELADLVVNNGKNDNSQDVLESSEDEEVDSKCVMVARDASKRILISRAPPVLTIHLKRFCQDARGRLSKLNGHVNFGDKIDLKPYMDPSCCNNGDTFKYQLVGVVEHSGTMRGGHYVAYVKGVAKGNMNNYSWYHASDAYIREASLEEVLGCEAYILFYEEMNDEDVAKLVSYNGVMGVGEICVYFAQTSYNDKNPTKVRCQQIHGPLDKGLNTLRGVPKSIHVAKKKNLRSQVEWKKVGSLMKILTEVKINQGEDRWEWENDLRTAFAVKEVRKDILETLFPIQTRGKCSVGTIGYLRKRTY
ncbi:hypothetical protein E3N88_15031 [Mikania micrantha]|uniref:ubiquitinyl hydrolase 1 n=1 Tax=Mikania micrantha TaxID=192012 RepID=A0A5N6P4W1_9ASTR|nr:hypothetical protein E3N88_15031 [Mikania micrantha]